MSNDLNLDEETKAILLEFYKGQGLDEEELDTIRKKNKERTRQVADTRNFLLSRVNIKLRENK